MSQFGPGIEAYLQEIRDTVGIHPKLNRVENAVAAPIGPNGVEEAGDGDDRCPELVA